MLEIYYSQLGVDRQRTEQWVSNIYRDRYQISQMNILHIGLTQIPVSL